MAIQAAEDEKEAELQRIALANKHEQQLGTRMEAERRREELRMNRIQRGKDKEVRQCWDHPTLLGASRASVSQDRRRMVCVRGREGA